MCFDMIYHGQDEECHCISGRNANAAMNSRSEGLVSIFQLKNPSYSETTMNKGQIPERHWIFEYRKSLYPKINVHFQYFSAKSKQFTSNLLKQ